MKYVLSGSCEDKSLVPWSWGSCQPHGYIDDVRSADHNYCGSFIQWESGAVRRVAAFFLCLEYLRVLGGLTNPGASRIFLVPCSILTCISLFTFLPALSFQRSDVCTYYPVRFLLLLTRDFRCFENPVPFCWSSFVKSHFGVWH